MSNHNYKESTSTGWLVDPVVTDLMVTELTEKLKAAYFELSTHQAADKTFPLLLDILPLATKVFNVESIHVNAAYSTISTERYDLLVDTLRVLCGKPAILSAEAHILLIQSADNGNWSERWAVRSPAAITAEVSEALACLKQCGDAMKPLLKDDDSARHFILMMRALCCRFDNDL